MEEQFEAERTISIKQTLTEPDIEPVPAELEPVDRQPLLAEPELNIFHGESVTDRKSTFQAHVVEVQSTSEVV